MRVHHALALLFTGKRPCFSQLFLWAKVMQLLTWQLTCTAWGHQNRSQSRAPRALCRLGPSLQKRCPLPRWAERQCLCPSRTAAIGWRGSQPWCGCCPAALRCAPPAGVRQPAEQWKARLAAQLMPCMNGDSQLPWALRAWAATQVMAADSHRQLRTAACDGVPAILQGSQLSPCCSKYLLCCPWACTPAWLQHCTADASPAAVPPAASARPAAALPPTPRCHLPPSTGCCSWTSSLSGQCPPKRW